MAVPAALVTDCTGETLTAEEARWLTRTQPYGIILFARNCATPAQVTALVADVKSAVGRDNLAILIDQEGGRVARLKPPHWRKSPPAGLFARMALKNMAAAQRAAYLNARLMADELRGLGINVDCAPVADLSIEGAHDIIGDRAYGGEPQQVAVLAREVARGLTDGGVLPIIKHIPGHGRAGADSHHELPVVDAPLALLEATDFKAFRLLRDLPVAMTAHILYTALDAGRVSTFSPEVIGYIRKRIGFEGLLLSDDIVMKALGGSLISRVERCLGAGCDIVLHCNGSFEDRQAVADAVPAMTPQACERSARAFATLSAGYRTEDTEAVAEELEALLAA